MLDMEFVLKYPTLSQSNDLHTTFNFVEKKPYLSYIIRISTTRLHTHKLSEKQISLYQKICDLRFDENLTWKQVANKLNKLGYTSSRGGKNTSSTVCSTYFKIRKHFQKQNIYHPPSLDDVKLIWE